MGKESNLKIKPTNNDSAYQADITCPLTVPIVTREMISERCDIIGPLNFNESLRDKRVIGMDCAYKIKQGFLEERCVFERTEHELNCPLVDSDQIKKFIRKRAGVEKIKQLGREFRKDNPELYGTNNK